MCLLRIIFQILVILDVADYFRKSYEEFMGASTNEVKYCIYTLEEQIDRYAKNISFWFIQLEKAQLKKILFITSAPEYRSSIASNF